MGLLDRLAPRRTDAEAATAASADEALFATKALKKFLEALTAKERPVLLDVGPVVGSNVSFFGEQLGCKLLVEDVIADVDRHLREEEAHELPEFFKKRFPQADASIDGVLCWDILDHLERPAAQALATQLARLLRPQGVLLGFFGTARPAQMHYVKYQVVDEVRLRPHPYAPARGRLPIIPNREIIRLFSALRVSDSFLLKNNFREILFRKPA